MKAFKYEVSCRRFLPRSCVHISTLLFPYLFREVPFVLLLVSTEKQQEPKFQKVA